MDRERALRIKTTATEGPCSPENRKEVQQVQQEHSPYAYERDAKVASAQQWQMQKLACLKAKKPQRKVASAQQRKMQKSPTYVEMEKLLGSKRKPKQQRTSSTSKHNWQSQTSHINSGGTVLGQTRQRREGYRIVRSKPQKDHKFPDK